ncbi:degT/DnrJ/EryC1/StrS aminotransferase [Paenibacillus sp. SYP-B3998]|uniref:DegT/DnrJ/EryC1/StrS aminotransferase n=1 Tax=Paenibacillus sp. SYP-B3998 TaxID=2678564 RepID=A0A6G3ZWV2_9BACL|nr:degT/DnrJ/EryC1/StrS aminotransferase [Paenibacillus sp. SYP-B3998]NEW06693.1 degT/DnrJ/EryC1/StrS aminotransferase [Paenibacillus sp. SYP-B3998]
MKNTLINKDHFFSLSFVLSRVLNTGVIMSIEKNENELKGLEKSISKITKAKYVSLFNSYTGAVHAALWGQDIGHGSSTRLDQASKQEQKFIHWLGVNVTSDSEVKLGFEKLSVNWDNLAHIEDWAKGKLQSTSVLVLDFTELGFGPCAAIALNEHDGWKKAERLKIFGAFDLKTMWTQEESELDIQPAIQFNYRLSPLVAGCVKLSLLKRSNEHED